jgi:hypothetical protein
MMVSIWWVILAFVLGGYAGMLVFALMGMAAREEVQGVRANEALEQDSLGPVPLEARWSAK